MDQPEEIKFYFDYKSPFAYLAFEPFLALEDSHNVRVRAIPTEVEIQASLGGEVHERTPRAWAKVRYLYLDARRFANDRGMIIRGPRKIYDSRLSLIGGLYAQQQGVFMPYSRRVFAGFFEHTLDIEDLAALEGAITEAGGDSRGLRAYAEGEGAAAYDRLTAERHADHIFGVPTLLVRGEPFWGYDRLDWVIRRLDAAGLRRAEARQRSGT